MNSSSTVSVMLLQYYPLRNYKFKQLFRCLNFSTLPSDCQSTSNHTHKKSLFVKSPNTSIIVDGSLDGKHTCCLSKNGLNLKNTPLNTRSRMPPIHPRFKYAILFIGSFLYIALIGKRYPGTWPEIVLISKTFLHLERMVYE